MKVSAEKIHSAIYATYRFAGWKFENEAEFKHELFHRLALTTANGSPINEAEPGAITARLHAEGKVENGNPKKADLIICDPTGDDSELFNYRVEQIFELKKRFKKIDITSETEKLSSYRMNYDAVWFVSAESTSLESNNIPQEIINAKQFYFIEPSPDEKKDDWLPASDLEIEEALIVIKRCITECLKIYGKNKKQYKSFFWCNYEHELERHHSYPCEGDFNAQLYHRLRVGLPSGIKIRSEYSPPALGRKRIDLFVENPKKGWSVPIEIKMNWDQFKPKYSKGIPKTSEANTIIERFRVIFTSTAVVSPILVVIQGDWRIPNKRVKESATDELCKTGVPIELVSFYENTNQIKWELYGQ